MKYILVKKMKNKWYGVAGWNPPNGTCLANAEDAFEASGYKWNRWENAVRCCWGEIENQKNYAGRLPEFKEVPLRSEHIEPNTHPKIVTHSKGEA